MKKNRNSSSPVSKNPASISNVCCCSCNQPFGIKNLKFQAIRLQSIYGSVENYKKSGNDILVKVKLIACPICNAYEEVGFCIWLNGKQPEDDFAYKIAAHSKKFKILNGL